MCDRLSVTIITTLQIDSVLEGLANSLERADHTSEPGDLWCCHGNCTTTPPLVTNVYSWLGEIGMAAYASLLQNNGYDSLAYCNLLDDEVLSEIGITSIDDRR